ncbi:hypothetical protein GCM10022238_25960 [Gordonia hankookensis]
MLERGADIVRAVIVGGQVDDLYADGRECRYLTNTEVVLPEGLYWFEAVDGGGLVMQIAAGVGGPAASSRVTPVDQLDDDDPLVAGWEWAEQLWDEARPVPRPRFAVDEHALSRAGDADVVIRRRRFLQRWVYTVSLDGKQVTLVESDLLPRPISDDPVSWVADAPAPASRFSATLTRAKLLGGFSNTLFSFRATRTTFRPYQFKPVLKMLETGKARILIADEVGLGKTIEAGLLWAELEARREADRVLVVSPSSLVEKWIGEMRERFGFEMTRLDTQELAKFTALHQENRLPARASYVASLETLRKWEGLDDLREFPPSFDLIIVDEAHSMRNRDTKSYFLGTELSDWATNLVFLTATPINLRQDDLLSLLELLSPEDAGDIEDLLLRLEPNRVLNAVAVKLRAKGVDGRELTGDLSELADMDYGRTLIERHDFQQLIETLSKPVLSPRDVVVARGLLSRLNTLSAIITRTKKVEVDDRKSTRSEVRETVTWTESESRFYNEFVAWCDARAKEAGLPLYFAMQMPLRLASACLPMARQAVLDPDGFGRLSDEDDPSVPAAPRLAPHPELIATAEALASTVDTKFEALIRVLERLDVGNRRCLLFTHSRKALSYLEQRLGTDYRVAVLHGGVDPSARLEVMADFRAGRFDLVLANRVASEGLDFEFCSAVINYDLPWNPMEVEQRIGRIDRIGQVEEKILVVNFLNNETIDERIMHRLLERIRIFESTIGQLEPIISVNATEALRAGFDFSLDDAEREQKLFEALAAVEEQRAGLEEVTDASTELFVSGDVDVDGLEDDLVRTGRYVGQHELALLIDDWAQTDGAEGVAMSADRRRAEVTGNARMAARLDQSARAARGLTSEARAVSAQLRHEAPIHVVLDQELARTGGGSLLTASHPLAIAAASMPHHRQARFGSIAVRTADTDAHGDYLVLLARADSEGRSSSEIWGSAVTLDGRAGGSEPVDLLLAALAEGRIEDHALTESRRMSRLVEMAQDSLLLRQVDEQARREQDFHSARQARVTTLKAQYERRATAVRRRIDTAMARGRDSRVIALFESQLARAERRFAELAAEVGEEQPPVIMLEPLVVCCVRLTSAECAP